VGSRATAAKPTHVAWRERRHTPEGDFGAGRQTEPTPTVHVPRGWTINQELIRLGVVSGLLLFPLN